MASKRVLVLGSRGRVGAALVEAYSAAGWTVIAQARRAAEGDGAGEGAARDRARGRGAIERVGVALEDTAGLARSAAGATVVVHAVNPVYTDWAKQALALAEQGMAVAEALGATFLLPGNVYNYGTGIPAVVSSECDARADTRKGRIREAMEDAMRARAPRLRSAVLRAGDFFGSGTGSWFDLVVTRSLPSGELVYPGPLGVAHAWAYVPDLARAFVALSDAPELPAFSRWNFAGHTLTGAELLAAIEREARALGLIRADGRCARGTMPWWLMRLAAPFHGMSRELVEMEYLWRAPHALDGSALESLVGPLASTPLDEALRRSLAPLAAARR